MFLGEDHYKEYVKGNIFFINDLFKAGKAWTGSKKEMFNAGAVSVE